MSDSGKLIKKQRFEWLDSCKGFAILLVVVGHMVGGYMRGGLFPDNMAFMQKVHNTIYSFHMPLFMCISGYVFYMAYLKNSRVERLKLSVINNVYIYVVWNCITWIVKYVLSAYTNASVKVSDLIMIPIQAVDILWYLYVLIIFYVVFGLIYEKIQNIDDRLLLCICAAISAVSSCVDIWLPFHIISALTYSVFFALGISMAKSNMIDWSKHKILKYTVSAILILIAVIFSINLFTIPVLGIIIAFVITAVFMVFFYNCKQLNTKNVFSFLGKHSLEIYVIHNFIATFFRVILPKIGVNNFYVNLSINCVASIIIPILCSVILRKINLYEIIFRPANYFADKK